MSKRSLDSQTRKALLKQIEETGETDLADVVELVRSHYVFDALNAKERELRDVSRRILASYRDQNGVRRCFAAQRERYIDVDTTADLEAINIAEARIETQKAGLEADVKCASAESISCAILRPTDMIPERR